MRLKQFLVFALATVFGCAVWAQAAPAPVNPHATPEARALFAYLDSISGQATITGQHNYPNDGSRWTDLAYDLTGKYPGLFGEDFGFSAGDDKDSVLSRPAMIEEVKRQYRNGAVIALTWHAVKPTEDEPVTFRDSVQGHLTDYEWQELLTPGSPLYNRWCAQVDVIAGYLRQLRDAHVPVLFRPYHEINGNWFWWTGRAGKDGAKYGSAALYRQLYDRFVNVHHLDNLVWVWNVNAPGGNAAPIEPFYPGPQFADVVTMDIYGEFSQEYYTSMLALADGKPIALAEVGGQLRPEVFDRQPRWAYFMAWSGMGVSPGAVDAINAIYHGPRALNRDDPQLAGPMAAMRKASTGGASAAEPVTPGATPEAKALLTRLVAAPGQLPEMYGAELGGSAESRAAIVKEALAARDRLAVVSLSWRAARPTDGAPASEHGQLTDFEWNELLTPGSSLNRRWCAQVDEAAETPRELEKSGIAVLWNPYPVSNGKEFWWAGRKGIHGSAELYRQLFDRLVNHDRVHNLLWVWEAVPSDFRSGGAGVLSDFFPGLLYTDALELRLNELDSRSYSGRMLAQIAVGKPIGVEVTGNLPLPDAFTNSTGWAWVATAHPN